MSLNPTGVGSYLVKALVVPGRGGVGVGVGVGVGGWGGGGGLSSEEAYL